MLRVSRGNAATDRMARAREREPGQHGQQHGRPQHLTADEGAALDRPGLEQLQVPEVAAEVAHHAHRPEQRGRNRNEQGPRNTPPTQGRASGTWRWQNRSCPRPRRLCGPHSELMFRLRTVCIPFFHMNAISVRPVRRQRPAGARARAAPRRGRRRLSVAGFCDHQALRPRPGTLRRSSGPRRLSPAERGAHPGSPRGRRRPRPRTADATAPGTATTRCAAIPSSSPSRRSRDRVGKRRRLERAASPAQGARRPRRAPRP